MDDFCSMFSLGQLLVVSCSHINGNIFYWIIYYLYEIRVRHVTKMCKYIQADELQQVLHKALDVISSEKQYQERCLSMLASALQSYEDCTSEGTHKSDADRVYLSSKYQLIVSSALMTTLPRHFPGMCIHVGHLEIP